MITIPVLIFALYFSQRLLGYYPGEAFWKVAEIAAKKGDVSICKRIINPFPAILGPTAADARISCIHEYAKLTHDPSVCELLMPSSYGLSCVGVASESPICGVNTGFEVQWHEGETIERSSLKDCQKSNNRSKRGDQCCIIATVSAFRTFNDCSALAKDVPLFDNCLNQLSFKNHDPSTCESIQDPNIKAGCIVSATALQKDPSICTGCTPSINSIEDLK